MTILYKHRIYCETSGQYEFAWTETDTAITTCPINSNHSVDQDSESIIDINSNNSSIKNQPLPFAQKLMPDGKRIFIRVHGVSVPVSGAADNIDFTVPYANCKLTEIEISNCEFGDKVNFKILDTSSGTITGIPYYVLNQYGFDVNMPNGTYTRRSSYDADLVAGLILRLEYDAVNSDILPKNVGVNFVLHEIKV